MTASSIALPDQTPLTPKHATARQVVDLFMHGAKGRSQNSRRRIRFCQKLRRNLIGVTIPSAFFDQYGSAARDWAEVCLPERQELDLSLTQSLGAREPQLKRPPVGTNDTAQTMADEYESWLNAVREQIYPHDAIIGKAIQDGEYGLYGLPAAADMMKTPQYMAGDKPDPLWDRDHRDRAPEHPSYGGRHEGKSAKSYEDAYTYHMANHLPFAFGVIPALDCIPLFRRGWHRERFELAGLVRRSLFDREDLLKQRYRWMGQENRVLVPRGYSEDRQSPMGADGQLWLYEAFLLDDNGRPFIARTVGGRGTWDLDGAGTVDDDKSAVIIDLEDEYGLCDPMWSYQWGLHTEDDDPDYRGMPFIYPLVPTILGIEATLSAAKTQMWDNAFSGHVTRPDKDTDPRVLMSGSDPKSMKLRDFRKPKMGEIVLMPGPVEPFAGAKVGDDAWKMAEAEMRLLRENTPGAQTFGGAEGAASGHAQVVNYDLFTAAKRHILDSGRQAAQFFGERVGMIAVAFARGDIGKHKVRVPVYVTTEVEQDDGSTRQDASSVEFNERWIAGSYRVIAEYPDEENLAKIDLTFKLWQNGAATWEDLQAARGKPSPETERIKVGRDQQMQSDEGRLSLAARIARYRGDYEKAERLDEQMQQQFTEGGLPTAAVAPEFGQTAAPTENASMIQTPDMVSSMRGGIEAGQMGTAARQADAAAQMQIASSGGGGV